jgi:hypothetical protein
VSVPKLPDLPWEVWAVVGLGLALVLWKAAGKTAADAGVALGTAGAQAVGGAVAGVSFGVGDALGVPRTNESECDRALREGRMWDASFACPAGKFIKGAWGAITD